MNNRIVLVALCALCLSSHSLTAFEEIPDQSNLPLLNQELSVRQTARIRLNNGLEAYLVSDPGADQGAAALAVGAGSWDDPSEYPGMAHFCEHMLFMGSKKFPHENEFSSLVADYTGQTNAYTSVDRTVYMVSASHGGFLPILERFSRFFIDPLFHPSGIARELHAVDQEFSKNIENDGWREYMIFKETGNPNHPNAKFSTGNSETLANIPQNALIEWHKNHYSANKMRLVIYSSLPLSTLKETVQNFFADVPARSGVDRAVNEEQLTSSNQRGRIIYIKPIKEHQTLNLSWELPRDLSLDPTQSAQLVAYALGRGQKHSLREQLKQEGLIDDLTISVGSLGGKDHRFFEISLNLTDRGINELNTAILRCFQALNGLRSSSVPPYLYDELQATIRANYQFQSRQDPFQYASTIAAQLLDEQLTTYPRTTLLATNYDPKQVSAVLRHLTVEQCLIFVQADPTKSLVPPQQKERWMGGEYTLKDVSSASLYEWKTAASHPKIRLAPPNPFIPASFDLHLSGRDAGIPRLISSDKGGVAYYATLGPFQTPEAVLALRILTPHIEPTARSLCLNELYLDHLSDSLHPTLAAASQARLQASFALDKNRLQIRISGFSDKAPLLLQELLKKMNSLEFPTKEAFEAYRTKHVKECANAEKDLAFIQARELAASLINPEQFTRKEKRLAFQNLSYEEYKEFHKDLFKQTYMEAFFSGNLSQKAAESSWLDVRHLLGKQPYLKEHHPQIKILSFPQGGPFALKQTTEAAGNAALLVIDLGSFTFEKRAAHELLTSALKESFFNTLRTKQKTGYIAHSFSQESEFRLFQHFLVQSNSHQPDDLLHRFELFLESTLQEFTDFLPEQRFNTLKNNLIQSLQTRFRSLKDKSALWEQLAFERDANFSWVEERIAGFETLSYAACRELAHEFLSRANRKRLAILMEGKLKAPFIYEPITPSEIAKQGEYLSRAEQLLGKGLDSTTPSSSGIGKK